MDSSEDPEEALVEEDVEDDTAEQPTHLHAPAAEAVDDAALDAFLQAADAEAPPAPGIATAPAAAGAAPQQVQQLQEEEEVYEADYDASAEEEPAPPVHEPATPAPAAAPAAQDSLPDDEPGPAAAVEWRQHQPQPEPYAAAVLLPSTTMQHQPASPARAVDVALSAEQLPVARLTSPSSGGGGQQSRLGSSTGHQRQPSGSQWGHEVPAASAAAPVHASILASPGCAADAALSSDDEAADWPSAAAAAPRVAGGLRSSNSAAGSPAAAPRQRPSSASPAVRGSGNNRQQQQERPPWQDPCTEPESLPEVLPVAAWSVSDVCDWVDGLGLSQYRKRFLHHVVDGRLLSRLDGMTMRTELCIGPLGHRVLLLEAIEAIGGADLRAAAAAGAVGVTPEELAADGGSIGIAARSPGAAAAVLVAGLIAQRAQQRRCQDGAGGSPAHGGNSPAGRGRARPSSAPERGRSASPAGRSSPSPGALGPAAGRTSVFEQRARILFDLQRAQARAAAAAGAASDVGGIVKRAQREVAALQGQLTAMDRDNKLAVRHAAGTLDTRGTVPWQHVGKGTRAADPHPERNARPWDAPEADLTFAPKLSAASQRIMAEARGSGGGRGGGFLDRLAQDICKREAKQRELERRYYSSPGSSAPVSKAVAADIAMLAQAFSHKGWASLSVPPGGSTLDEESLRELEGQLDEVVESYSKELGLGEADSKQAHAIVAAHGAAKVAAMAAAVRTQQFMDRYQSDISTRGSRLQQLQDSWLKQQLSQGRPGLAAALTPEQKDLAQAVQMFKGLGWEGDAEADDCDGLLSALLQRARHHKTEAERLHEKQRAAAAAAAAGASAQAAGAAAGSLPAPVIDWGAAPWSADGLGALTQRVVDAKREAAEAAAAKAAGAGKPSPGGGPAAGPATAAAADDSPLDNAVRLLAGVRWAGLDKLDAAKGRAKKLVVYRALRTQQFLAFTAADLAARETKQQAQLAQLAAARRGKVASRAQLDSFYTRLQADGERRKAEAEKARHDKAEREAKALALVSVGPGFSRRPRPHSAK